MQRVDIGTILQVYTTTITDIPPMTTTIWTVTAKTIALIHTTKKILIKK